MAIELKESKDVLFSAEASEVFAQQQRTWLARRHVLEREKARIDRMLEEAVTKTDALALAGDNSFGEEKVRDMFRRIDYELRGERDAWCDPLQPRYDMLRMLEDRMYAAVNVTDVMLAFHAETVVELCVAGVQRNGMYYTLCVDYGYDVKKFFAEEGPRYGFELRVPVLPVRG